MVFLEHKLLYSEPQAVGEYVELTPAAEDPGARMVPHAAAPSPDARCHDPRLRRDAAGGGARRRAPGRGGRDRSRNPRSFPALPDAARHAVRAPTTRPVLAIVEEAPGDFGVGAEIAASLVEAGWRGHLARIAAPPVPIPSARSLEAQILPDEDRICREVVRLTLAAADPANQPYADSFTYAAANNNDDIVTVRQIVAPAGTSVRKGDPIVELETDKAVFVVESEDDGWVLKHLAAEGDQVAVGSILVWLGASAEETAPADGNTAAASRTASAPPTARAQMLLSPLPEGRRHSLRRRPPHRRRGGGGDAAPGLQPKQAAAPTAAPPVTAGTPQALTHDERGMLRTVLWQRDYAVPGYIEIPCDEAAWKDYGLAFQKRHRMLVNPSLSLMARQLAELARDHPKLNSTLLDNARFAYSQVNLGSPCSPAMRSTWSSWKMPRSSWTNCNSSTGLSELQRHAMAHKLSPAEIQGATVSFSSMARWQVTRHMPVLPPFTSLIVAHAQGLLGATYDHRVLSGFDVVNALKLMAAPPQAKEQA